MLKTGHCAEVSVVVQSTDTAKALSIAAEDAFPEVYATSRMIALMEIAAARAMRTVLQPGQLSVGTALNVRHTAATPVGCKVRALATYLETEGRIYRFRVEAFDESGPIGEGEHARAIVDTERLVGGAQRRRHASE